MENWQLKIKPALATLFYSRDKQEDPRLGDIVPRFDPKKNNLGEFRHALIGYPEDRGIRRNLGRSGARLGPREFRRAFYRLTAKDLFAQVDLGKMKLVDLGDVVIGKTLETSQQNLAEVIAACLQAGVFPIVIGGGHETAWGHFRGYRPSPPAPLPPGGEGCPSVLNIDAHLDLRPLIKGKGHSGSSFRQMIEAGLPGENLTVFGLQGFCNAERDLKFAKEHRVKIFWLEEILKEGIKKSLAEALPLSLNPLYATVCLDALRAAEFPATSAAPAQGFTLREMFKVLEVLARQSNLKSLDLVEFSSPLDPTGVCAKAVALMVYRFLVGRQH